MFTILFPMFALSGVLAYLLYRELEKEDKKKEKKGEQHVYTLGRLLLL